MPKSLNYNIFLWEEFNKPVMLAIPIQEIYQRNRLQ
mgnify:FL=1